MNDLQPLETTAVTMTDIMRSEIDMQITTAKKYPRSLEKFRQQALSMATIDREIAASCFYKLKRKDADTGTSNYIEGPSVRLAEIVASSWGNIRFGARIVSEDVRFVVAQGMAHDLENNVCNVIEVSRRITKRDGRRYGDDMIAVTKNAACAIALRNAIFKTVPFAYAKSIMEQAKKAAIGDVKLLPERRQQMIEAFGKMGVSLEQIISYCEKPSVEDIGITEIEDLLGTFNAIKDGDQTIEEAFGKAEKNGKPAPTATAVTPPEGGLTARQKVEVAKAKLFAKHGKKSVEAVLSATLTKDLKDCTDDECLAVVKALDEAAAK